MKNKKQWIIVAVLMSFITTGAQTSVFAMENFFSASCRPFLDVPGDAEVNQQLAQVRRATAKYHDINAAIADDFVVIGDGSCVDHPNGTHGIGYVNVARFRSPEVNPDEPEILNYIPTGDGNLRLINVVYLNRALFRDTRPPDAPGYLPGLFPWRQAVIPPYLEEVSGSFSLFGQQAGRGFDQRWIYLLSAWIWSPNPNGMFAGVNPSLNCTANN